MARLEYRLPVGAGRGRGCLVEDAFAFLQPAAAPAAGLREVVLERHRRRALARLVAGFGVAAVVAREDAFAGGDRLAAQPADVGALVDAGRGRGELADRSGPGRVLVHQAPHRAAYRGPEGVGGAEGGVALLLDGAVGLHAPDPHPFLVPAGQRVAQYDHSAGREFVGGARFEPVPQAAERAVLGLVQAAQQFPPGLDRALVRHGHRDGELPVRHPCHSLSALRRRQDAESH